MPKVSIIVPVYNVEQYLSKCLDSILSQTLSDIEIIVVNDGSPDNSRAIIDKYAEIDNRIIAIHKENGGLSDARNCGFKHATGEFIGYVDSDDWIDAHMFEKMYNKALLENADVVVCDFYHSNGTNHTVIPGMNIYTDDMIKNYVLSTGSACNKLYRRELINSDYWIKGVYYEDFASNYFLIDKISKITYLNEPLYYYFQRSTSIMNEKKYNPKFRDILNNAIRINDVINSNTIFQKYIQEFEFSFIENLIRGTYFRLRKMDNEEAQKLLIDISEFFKQNFNDFQKNKYFKKQNFKYKLITSLIYNQKYKLLNLIIK